MLAYARGDLTAAALEVYRIAAARDHQDPTTLLSEANLMPPPPAAADATPQALLRVLIQEADRYLATLPGPGVAESRAGLNQWAAGPVTLSPRANPVIAAHLPQALAALTQTHPALAQAIAGAAPHLTWITYDGYDPATIGPSFGAGHAYATLIGPDAPIPAPDFDLGLFLIAPHILYRDHHHAAPELYAPLTGPHGWRFGPDRPLHLLAAHHPVWNPPHRPHLTKVGATPFLALFCWTRDVQALAQVIAAPDWPDLEALRLAP